jgi:hypothetical protein
MGYKRNPNQDDSQYRETISRAMELLSAELVHMGYSTPSALADEKLIDLTIKKLKLLRKLILTLGLNEKILDVIMSE